MRFVERWGIQEVCGIHFWFGGWNWRGNGFNNNTIHGDNGGVCDHRNYGGFAITQCDHR